MHPAGTDHTAAYKVGLSILRSDINFTDMMKTQRYTIYRKMPMLARQERTLAIDGVYIHVSLPGRE